MILDSNLSCDSHTSNESNMAQVNEETSISKIAKSKVHVFMKNSGFRKGEGDLILSKLAMASIAIFVLFGCYE